LARHCASELEHCPQRLTTSRGSPTHRRKFAGRVCCIASAHGISTEPVQEALAVSERLASYTEKGDVPDSAAAANFSAHFGENAQESSLGGAQTLPPLHYRPFQMADLGGLSILRKVSRWASLWRFFRSQRFFRNFQGWAFR
jgi:hypothetical protein